MGEIAEIRVFGIRVKGELKMLETDSFCNLEEVRLKELKHKVIKAILDFDKNPNMQWTNLKLGEGELETLLRVIGDAKKGES